MKTTVSRGDTAKVIRHIADLLHAIGKWRKPLFRHSEYAMLAELVNNAHGLGSRLEAEDPEREFTYDERIDYCECVSPPLLPNPPICGVCGRQRKSEGFTPDTIAGAKAKRLVLKRYAKSSDPLPDLPPGVGLPNAQPNNGSVVHPEDEQQSEQH